MGMDFHLNPPTQPGEGLRARIEHLTTIVEDLATCSPYVVEVRANTVIHHCVLCRHEMPYWDGAVLTAADHAPHCPWRLAQDYEEGMP